MACDCESEELAVRCRAAEFWLRAKKPEAGDERDRDVGPALRLACGVSVQPFE